MSKAKQILLDLNKELQGRLLSDNFNIEGIDYGMKLLTDSENAWVYSKIDSSNHVVIALTSRTAILSVGIRSIGGCPLSEIFEDSYDDIIAKRNKLSDQFEKFKPSEIEELNLFLEPYSGMEGKYLTNKLMYDWLIELPSPYVDTLYRSWTSLIMRQAEMQENIKKLSLGNSETSTQESLTEVSPSGDTSAQESE